MNRDRQTQNEAGESADRTEQTMNTLSAVAAPFVEMAHRIVWASVATVDARGR